MTHTSPFGPVGIMADPTNHLPRRETRTERMQWKLRPTLANAVATNAEREGISETALAERALEKETNKVPIVGDVPCGEPGIIPDEYIETRVNVGDILQTRPGDFLLRARGTSMIGGGIGDADLVLIRPQRSCDSGDICAVLLDGPMGTRATLKRVIYTDSSPIVKLVPMNDAHPTIEIDTTKQELRICGTMKGLIKNQ